MKRIIPAFLGAIFTASVCIAADEVLPADFGRQLEIHAFVGLPREITAGDATLFAPKRVRLVVKDAAGKEETKEYIGLYLEFSAYGDVDGQKGIGLTARYAGAVYLFDRGKLVSVVPESTVQWIDGKPEKLPLRIWLERREPNHLLEATPGQRPPTPPSPSAGAPHL